MVALIATFSTWLKCYRTKKVVRHKVKEKRSVCLNPMYENKNN